MEGGGQLILFIFFLCKLLQHSRNVSDTFNGSVFQICCILSENLKKKVI
jgi:hypothetical protein